MALARKVTPEAAIFVHFIATVIAEDWTVDGVRLGPSGRIFFQEIEAALEVAERRNVNGLRANRGRLVDQAIAALEADAAPDLAGEMRLLREATAKLDQANAIAEQILADNRGQVAL